MIPPRVWYLSYGSNMWWDRFRCYLAGGVPPGSSRDHPGARDPAPPVSDAPHRVPHRLFFADQSQTWGGGGVAYLDAETGSGEALARRWLITDQQFADVVAQERGQQPGSAADLDLESLKVHGRQALGQGWYDLLLMLGEINDVPLVTFTTSRSVSRVTQNPPSASYRATLTQGLMESHGLTSDEAHAYVEQAAAASASQARREAQAPDKTGR